MLSAQLYIYIPFIGYYQESLKQKTHECLK